MMRKLGLMLVVAAIPTCGWPPDAAHAEEQSVAGTWTGSIATDNGDAGDVELVLKQDHETISGTLSNTLTGLAKSPLVGTLKGNSLSLRVPATGAQWDATVTGNTMEGTARRKGKDRGHFTATKDD